jgi:PAS domain S-box-containing protein
MASDDHLAVSDAELRRRAEAITAQQTGNAADSIENLSSQEIQAMLHELHVHQIELELQNEELRRAQAELDAARARYFDLYHLAPVGYVTLSEKGLFLEANLTASTMLGAARGTLARQLITRFILADDQDIYYRLHKRLFETGEPQECDLRMLKKDGTLFWARLEAIISQDDEGNSVSRVVLSDISERKQAEDDHRRLESLKLETQIQQTQKLESLGVLASGIAHDFNNLMGGIFGYIDMAIEKSTDAVVTEYLNKAVATIDRARGLTAQLLTFAKGGAPLQKITQLFPFVHDTIQFALSGSNVSCKFAVADNLWPCNIDKNQISQVFDNLVINAQQAMPNGGTIEVTAANVFLSGKELPALVKGSYVRVSVKDYGIGILKESLPRIFDPFYTTKAKGHGLGLATCYSIISRHGGAIDVESEPGRGSTFHVYLPASLEIASAHAATTSIHHGSGMMIVMDDEEVMRDTLRSMLESLGYTVVCKNDGREVVNFYAGERKAHRPVSGIILDLTVPGGMGGKLAVAEIRKTDREIPIFAASGYTDDPVMMTPLQYGFTASIAKPFRKSDLVEMLDLYMKQEA